MTHDDPPNIAEIRGRFKSQEIRYREFPLKLLISWAVDDSNLTPNQKFLLKSFFIWEDLSFQQLRKRLKKRGEADVLSMIVPCVLAMREKLDLGSDFL